MKINIHRLIEELYFYKNYQLNNQNIKQEITMIRKKTFYLEEFSLRIIAAGYNINS
jgi:hypothetical protein